MWISFDRSPRRLNLLNWSVGLIGQLGPQARKSFEVLPNQRLEKIGIRMWQVGSASSFPPRFFGNGMNGEFARETKSRLHDIEIKAISTHYLHNGPINFRGL